MRDLIYRRTLKWINKQRRARGAPELDEILTGTRKVPGSCPVAHSLGSGAKVYGIAREANGRVDLLPLPVALFVRRFDRGGYPELAMRRFRFADLADPALDREAEAVLV